MKSQLKPGDKVSVKTHPTTNKHPWEVISFFQDGSNYIVLKQFAGVYHIYDENNPFLKLVESKPEQTEFTVELPKKLVRKDSNTIDGKPVDNEKSKISGKGQNSGPIKNK